VKPGDVFVAIPGLKADGAAFVPQAIEKGAKTIVTERDISVPEGIQLAVVPNSRKALAELSARSNDYPAKRLKIIGITGTNGKTTIAYLLESILKEAGFKVGLISTVEIKYDGHSKPSSFTTPESLELQGILAEMVKAGVTHLVMEVSSHALAQYRVHGLEFDIAIYTNLTHEHLDYHKTMEEYLKAKQQLFKMLKPDGVAVVNVDDPYSKRIIEEVEGEVIFYGIKQAPHELRSTKYSEFDMRLKDYDIRLNWMKVIIDSTEIRTPLIGMFNIYNILAAFQCGSVMHLDRKVIKAGIEKAYVPGRLERIDRAVPAGRQGQDFTVIVDFAHTPDALEQLLSLIKSLKPDHCRLILVFGCPGERDKEKRPLMGEIARKYADLIILTTDDPHGEDPEKIITEIVKGTQDSSKQKAVSSKQIIDRKTAIREAIGLAKKGDVVVIAGRGHEKYQDFSGKKVTIDDREVAREAIRTAEAGPISA
jgi:UDP-N-acetylmuramyl-tripeptide synthetase